MLINKVAYMIFIFLAGLFAILYNSYFTGLLFLSVVLIPVILLVILYITSTKVCVDLTTNQTIVKKGEGVEINLLFTNKSLFPVNKILLPIQYVNEVTGVNRQRIIELVLDQYSTQKVTINLQSDHCGTLNIILNKMILFDFLHLWKKRRKLSLNTVIAVLPETHEIDNHFFNKVFIHDSNSDSENYSKVKKGEDVSEVFEIRDYIHGDRPNRIHWKLSQRIDHVMVKEFSEPLKDSVAFILYPFCKENGSVRLNLMDGFLETVVTLSELLLQEGKAHTILWYDKILEQYNKYLLHNTEDKYQALSDVVKSPVLTEYRPVMKDFQKLNSLEYSGIILITTNLQEENLEYLLYQSKMTFCSLIFVNNLEQVSLSQNSILELDKHQIPYYEIDINNVSKSFQKDNQEKT